MQAQSNYVMTFLVHMIIAPCHCVTKNMIKTDPNPCFAANLGLERT